MGSTEQKFWLMAEKWLYNNRSDCMLSWVVTNVFFEKKERAK